MNQLSLPGSGILLHASPGVSWHFSLDLSAAPRSRVGQDTPGPPARLRGPLSSSPALLTPVEPPVRICLLCIVSLYHPHLQGEPCKLRNARVPRRHLAPVSIHHRPGSRGTERPVTSSHTGSRTQGSQIPPQSAARVLLTWLSLVLISAHLLSLCPEVR